MRLRLETSPAELAAKGEALLKALSGALEPVAPELAEQLQKALPPREHSLKYPALQELHGRMAAEYERTLARMLADIGRVLEPRGKRQESARGSRLQKAEPPQADGFEDHSAPIAEKDGRAYARIKVYLQRKGYKVSDFEPGGPLYGWSLNELLDLAHGKRD